MPEKSKTDHQQSSKGSSKGNPLADALERLERSVAQREGNRMASLVKPIKELADETNDSVDDKSLKKISKTYIWLNFNRNYDWYCCFILNDGSNVYNLFNC